MMFGLCLTGRYPFVKQSVQIAALSDMPGMMVTGALFSLDRYDLETEVSSVPHG